MNVNTFISELKGKGIQISLVGDQLKVGGPKEVLAPKIVEQLRRNKLEIIQLLTDRTPNPYIDPKTDDLVIPFNCLSRYQWWNDSFPDRMTVKQIRELIIEHIDSDFTPV